MKPFHFKRKQNVLWRLFCSVKCTIRVYNLWSHQNFEYFQQSCNRAKFHARPQQNELSWSILTHANLTTVIKFSHKKFSHGKVEGFYQGDYQI